MHYVGYVVKAQRKVNTSLQFSVCHLLVRNYLYIVVFHLFLFTTEHSNLTDASEVTVILWKSVTGGSQIWDKSLCVALGFGANTASFEDLVRRCRAAAGSEPSVFVQAPVSDVHLPVPMCKRSSEQLRT